ncbi:hypothetical protein AHAS_Ahas15G0123000 [Arachis hypogaea]
MIPLLVRSVSAPQQHAGGVVTRRACSSLTTRRRHGGAGFADSQCAQQHGVGVLEAVCIQGIAPPPRALYRASRYDTKEMDGPFNLLFAWAWERILCIAPVARHTLPSAEIPVAMRWSHSERTTAWLSKTVARFRHDIDYMEEVNIYGSCDSYYMDILRCVTPLLCCCRSSVRMAPCGPSDASVWVCTTSPARSKGNSSGPTLHRSSRSVAS